MRRRVPDYQSNLNSYSSWERKDGIRLVHYDWFGGWMVGGAADEGRGFGIIGDIVVGVLGALLGGFLFRSLGVSAGGGLLGSIIVATIGAVVLIFILRLIRRI